MEQPPNEDPKSDIDKEKAKMAEDLAQATAKLDALQAKKYGKKTTVVETAAVDQVADKKEKREGLTTEEINILIKATEEAKKESNNMAIKDRMAKIGNENWDQHTPQELESKISEMMSLLELNPDSELSNALNNWIGEAEMLIQKKNADSKPQSQKSNDKRNRGLNQHVKKVRDEANNWGEFEVKKSRSKKQKGEPDLITGVVQPKTETTAAVGKSQDEIKYGPKQQENADQEKTVPEKETSDALDVNVNEKEIKDEVKNLTPKEKERVEIGLHNIGFIVEKKKSEYFAKTFGWIGSRLKDKKSTTARFIKGIEKSYKEEEKIASHRVLAGREVRKLSKVANIGYLVKNIVRPVKLLADATGATPGSAQRLILAGAMLSGRMTGAMKEARLANEEVIQKTRIGRTKDLSEGENSVLARTEEDVKDVERAYEEAMKIYEKAQGRAGKTKGGKEGKDNVSVEELQNAYLRELPEDLQKRLENPAVGNGFLQKVLRERLSVKVDLLNSDILKIEENQKISEKEKRKLIAQKISFFEKRLLDYDRLISKHGEIDEYAMLAKLAESTSKNVVRGMTAYSLFLSAEKLFEGLARVIGPIDKEEIVESIKGGARKWQDFSSKAKGSEVAPVAPTPIPQQIETTPIPEAPAAETPEPITPAPTAPVFEPEPLKTEAVPDGQVEYDQYGNMNYVDPMADTPETPVADTPEPITDETLAKQEEQISALRAKLGLKEGQKLEIKADVFENDIAHEEQPIPEPKLPKDVEPTTKLDPLHDVLKNKVENDVIVTSSGKDGQNVVFGTGGRSSVAEAYEQARPNTGASVPRNTPDGYNVEYDSRVGITRGPGAVISPEIIRQSEALYSHNIEKIFPENTEEAWRAVSGTPAKEILTLDAETVEDVSMYKMAKYLDRIKEVTGLEPKGKSLFNWKGETTEEYIKRGLVWARQNGKLKSLEMQ